MIQSGLPSRSTARLLRIFLVLLMFAGIITVIFRYVQRSPRDEVEAAGETLYIDAPVQFLSNYTITAGQFLDSANTAYYVSPAASGLSLNLAGDASAAGNLVIGNAKSIRSTYGPLKLDYKSGTNAWTTGLSLQDTTGNIMINGNSFTVRVVSGSELGIFDSTGTQVVGFDEGT